MSPVLGMAGRGAAVSVGREARGEGPGARQRKQCARCGRRAEQASGLRCAGPRSGARGPEGRGSVGCRESHPGPSWGSDSGHRDPEPLPFGALRRLLGVLCLGWASKKVRRRSWGRGAPHGAGTEPGRAFGAWRTRPFGWGRQQLSVAWGCDIRCTSCPAD